MRRPDLWAIGLIGVVLLALFHKPLFFSYDETIRVIENDAPRFCRTRSLRLHGLLYPQDRSSVPQHRYFGYCGAIITDRGAYELPEDRYPFSIYTPRAELDDQLRDGCRFRVRIVSYGDRFRPGDRARVPIIHKITTIRESLGCDK